MIYGVKHFKSFNESVNEETLAPLRSHFLWRQVRKIEDWEVYLSRDSRIKPLQKGFLFSFSTRYTSGYTSASLCKISCVDLF